MDNVISKYVRKWFQLPVSPNIQHLSFPTNRLGINFSFAKVIYHKCKLSVRRILRQSKNTEIRKLYSITSKQNVRSDCIVNSVMTENPDMDSKQVSSKTDNVFQKAFINQSWKEFSWLKEQSVIVKHVVASCPSKVLSMWHTLLTNLPNNIICFVRKSLIFCLPNKTNLFRWKLVEDKNCSMCKNPETQLHIFSNCIKYLDRYTWRHDSILNTILNKLSRSTYDGIEIFSDCQGCSYPCTSDLFQGPRPDIVVKLHNKIVVIELTVCFDTNTEKSRTYKKNRYQNLREKLVVQCNEFNVIFLEFTTLGFISKESYKPFITFLRTFGINEERTVAKCMEIAIRGTYYIFCRRNKPWIVNDLLKFY